MTTAQQYKFWETIFRLGFRSAKRSRSFRCIYERDTEEYRWFRAGYIAFIWIRQPLTSKYMEQLLTLI